MKTSLNNKQDLEPTRIMVLGQIGTVKGRVRQKKVNLSERSQFFEGISRVLRCFKSIIYKRVSVEKTGRAKCQKRTQFGREIGEIKPNLRKKRGVFWHIAIYPQGVQPRVSLILRGKDSRQADVKEIASPVVTLGARSPLFRN